MEDSPARQTSRVYASAAQGSNSPAKTGFLDFRTLFELEAPYVVRTLRRLGVRPGDTEDMAHEVFIAVHRHLPEFDATRPIRPWLFGFALRVVSHYRRRPPGSSADGIEPEDPCLRADQLLEEHQRKELVLRALDGIELDRRAVFVMHELDGITTAEIAETLSIPLGTVYSRLRLAREDFAQAVRRLRAQQGIP